LFSLAFSAILEVMIDQLFSYLSDINTFFWGYVGFSLILGLGLYYSISSRFFQIRSLPSAARTFVHYLSKKHNSEDGIHPLRTFFASMGGMIGIGNIVGIVTAIELGGPGALLWVWISSLFGSIIKYSEVFLGFKYRVASQKSGFSGGPMYFLGKAFNSRIMPLVVAALLCLYGVEVYQFSVVTSAIETNWHIDRPIIVTLLMGLIFYAAVGGVNRVGKICSIIMPIFMATYTTMSLIVILLHLDILPSTILEVLQSAFTGHAAIGGFVGSTLLLAVQQGASSAAYAADIGIGTDSIIQSESSAKHPALQAQLSSLSVFIDCFICTLSMLLVLLTGVWKLLPAVEPSQYTQMALSSVFPGMNIFMPILFFILGYMTMISYFCVGLKCARFLSPKWGGKTYLLYAFSAFVFFSFFDQTKTRVVMSFVGGLLLTCNLIGVFRLRKEIHFAEPHEPTTIPVTEAVHG
jgi:AGCS family alanine or glycine:cation symporter